MISNVSAGDEMSDMALFIDVGVILIVSTVLAGIGRLLKQPTITAYIIAGIIIGPFSPVAGWFGVSLINDPESISILSEMGIALLLFIVGLEIDVDKLKHIGKSATLAGLAQVFAMSVIGFAFLQLLGFQQLESTYVAIALALSSTMVVIKLLSDMNELDTLHGRMVLGILLVQDFVAILSLAVLGKDGFAAGAILFSLMKGAGLFCIAIVCNKFILPHLLRAIAKSQELIFLSAISWCFALALLAYQLGYSISIGAFLAGLSLASFPFNLEIAGRVRSLRDFFATIFFTALGMQLALPYFKTILAPAIILSLLVLVGTPLIVFFIMKLSRYGNKTSFLSSLAIAQISEFSLIIMLQGQKAGAVHPSTVSMVTLIAIITIALSSYFIVYGEALYRLFQKPLAFFGKRLEDELTHIPKKMKGHAVIFGCHRIGAQVLEALCQQECTVAVVDFNPDVVKKLMAEKIPCIYGDMGDPEILDRVAVKDAKIIVSTVPDDFDNKLLLKTAKRASNTIIVTAQSTEEALSLYKLGADYVIIPRMLAGDFMSHALKSLDASKIKRLKEQHLKKLSHWINS